MNNFEVVQNLNITFRFSGDDVRQITEEFLLQTQIVTKSSVGKASHKKHDIDSAKVIFKILQMGSFFCQFCNQAH